MLQAVEQYTELVGSGEWPPRLFHTSEELDRLEGLFLPWSLFVCVCVAYQYKYMCLHTYVCVCCG